jgi:hypothetical protein
MPILSFAQKRIILTWDFYKYDKPNGAPQDARLACGIEFQYRKKFGIGNTIIAEFLVKPRIDTLKSFFNFDLKFKDDVLFNHEQGHADNTTIFAIKLKERFDQTKYLKTNYESQINKIFNEISLELDKQQKQYDIETDHGRNKDKQIEWNDYFKKELNIK